MGVHLSEGGGRTSKGGHDFDTHNAFLSEGGALAVVVREFPETPQGTRDNTKFPRLLRQSEARLCLACFPFRPA